MRVLVTGGAGYVGSVVSEELVRDGHDVVVYDNLYRGHLGAIVEFESVRLDTGSQGEDESRA